MEKSGVICDRSSKSEKESLQDSSETCCDVWFEDGDTDKKNHSAISETLPINITIQSSKQCSGGV